LDRMGSERNKADGMFCMIWEWLDVVAFNT
jgi:hypothetical protein